jgi:hypothetical protein
MVVAIYGPRRGARRRRRRPPVAAADVTTTAVPDDWADKWTDFHRPIGLGRVGVRPLVGQKEG